MRITQIELQNIRGFVGKNVIDVSPSINLLVGKNNTGKSTILSSVLLVQKTDSLRASDVTRKEQNGQIHLRFANVSQYVSNYGTSVFRDENYSHLMIALNTTNNGFARTIFKSDENANYTFTQTPGSEPGNLIYPFLSNRKVPAFDETVNSGTTNSVTGTLTHLYAKLNRLCNVNHQNSKDYQIACSKIIGFPVSPIASPNGQQGGYLVNAFSNILLDSMGDGIPHLLGLIVDLCVAENKIFLIEEPENDIHPHALKALLQLIVEKSETNQFFISTHSNIVTKYLGGLEDTKVFQVSMNFDLETKLPISRIEEIAEGPEARIRLLEELGYEPFDFDQWKAWLFLEESSAEVIIREVLIPMFVPELSHMLRTYSAHSVSEVEPRFRDFNNLFVFIHLEKRYKNKAWVVVDGGDTEKKIIEEMRKKYGLSGWNEENFLQFNEDDFEKYYPNKFQKEVAEVFAIEDRQMKRKRKKDLLDSVKLWVKENPVDAKDEFQKSAKEVIDMLLTIKEATI